MATVVSDTTLPVRWLLSQKFDSIDKIDRIGMPLLVVHGTDDRYVPARFSEQLYQAARPPGAAAGGGRHAQQQPARSTQRLRQGTAGVLKSASQPSVEISSRDRFGSNTLLTIDK